MRFLPVDQHSEKRAAFDNPLTQCAERVEEALNRERSAQAPQPGARAKGTGPASDIVINTPSLMLLAPARVF